ncbi:hypothetical protein [Parvibaculum sp.]|uniref:hypothetical protein n=1 Tax=Parvibaculum sp. TaxID=2024848 RepID=UPI0025F3A8D2|nr:hypothetical protein [Parvibaculum sp.]
MAAVGVACYAVWAMVPGFLFARSIVLLQQYQASIPKAPALMRGMCKRDGGLRIYKTTKNVDGYAILPPGGMQAAKKIAVGKVTGASFEGGCFPCFKELIGDGYEYIETYYVGEEDRLRSLTLSGAQYVRRTGLYRYRLVDRREEPYLCKQFDRYLRVYEDSVLRGRAKTYANVGAFKMQSAKYKEELHDKCIYAERISAFSSPYLLRHELKVVAEETEKGRSVRIRQFRNSVFYKDEQSVLAEAIGYVFYAGEGPNAISDESCGQLYLPPITKLLVPSTSLK